MDESPNSNSHVGTEELAKLLEESRRQVESVLDPYDIHPHFAGCSTCREQFEELASLDRQLMSVRPVESAPRQGNCPNESVWNEIAGGLIPADETLSLVEHASGCDHCGPRLHATMTEFAGLSGELSEEERRSIAGLDSSNVAWQQLLAQNIIAMRQPRLVTNRESTAWYQKWQGWLTVPRLAIAGVAVLALVGVGSWVVIQQYQPAAANRLLARAYTEKRTLELRIAGADYAPLRVSRGSSASFTSNPPALLKAEALIAGQLQSHPSDPAWLQAQARADVLEGKYDPAVESLRRALELEPHSSALLIDLATAYFQRAQQEDKKDDLGAAYEYLSQALRLHPDDPVALFNRALVAERQFLYQQALDDWDHYLRVDPGSEWADEARTRANALREKLKEHESRAKPLLSPEQVAAAATRSADVDQRVVDERIEEYLHEAVRSWLPRAFPERGSDGIRSAADANAAQALFFLADLTSRQHGDQWLADLLHGSSAPHFPQAITALARAIRANDAGEYAVSRQQAHLAEQLFRASGNTAGALRSEFEQSFEAQISRRSEQCRRQATTAAAESEHYSYPWLQTQLGLEKSVCSLLMGDLGTHEKAALRAQDRAEQAGYGALYLRALGFVADNKFDTGDPSGGWKLAYTGLDRYWSGQFPAMRGYNLYSYVASAAEAAGQSNLQVALWRESVAMIDANEDLLLRADVRNEMAKAASAAHQPEVAKRQYAEAARLYALGPQNEATRTHRLENEIMIAELEARQSAFDAALARLTRVQDEVRQLSNNFLAQIFYSTLGEVQLRSHHAEEAEQSFRPALRLAEKNLASLSSEANRVSWSNYAAPVYLGLAEAVLVQGREQESLDIFEWYLGAPQRIGAPGPISSRSIPEQFKFLPDPSQLLARLPLLSNQTVLAYGVLPDGLAIWVYDNRGISAKWIPKSPQELQDLASNFYAECSDPGSGLTALRRDGTTLYSLLIAPVEQNLEAHRELVIETEGFLARLPFEALLDSSNHYLIERVPIVHSSNMGSIDAHSIRVHLSQPTDTTISSDLPALVVGSTASSSVDGLIPLPDVTAEADAVAKSFHSARVLESGEATLSAVQSELPRAAVFHFAGHSLATPQRTGLLLAGGDGKADASQLMDATIVRQLDLQSLRLAMLSACSTGSGSGASNGFDNVTDALLRAGVPHVVASRWAVDSAETRGFVADFYHNALSGQTISNSTRLTALKMLLNQRTAHPYYWATFATYGRP